MEQPNLNYIKSLAKNDYNYEQILISVVKNELPFEIETYDRNMAKNDLIAAAQDIHKLKHKIMVLGMEKSYYIAEKHEDLLKNKSVELSESFRKILTAMNNFIQNR